MALTDNLFTYYKFDGNADNIAGDNLGDTTYNGTPTSYDGILKQGMGFTTGKFGQGLHFTTHHDPANPTGNNYCNTCPFVDVGNNAASSPYNATNGLLFVRGDISFSFWIKASDPLAEGNIINLAYGRVAQVQLYQGKISYSYDSGYHQGHEAGAHQDERRKIRNSTNISDNQWHHVVCTRNLTTGTMKIYIDGTSEDSGDPAYVGGTNPFTNELAIDANSWSAGYPVSAFKFGYIGAGTPQSSTAYWLLTDSILDDFAIWNRTITLAEVQDIHTRGFNGQSLLNTLIGSGFRFTIV